MKSWAHTWPYEGLKYELGHFFMYLQPKHSDFINVIIFCIVPLFLLFFFIIITVWSYF